MQTTSRTESMDRQQRPLFLHDPQGERPSYTIRIRAHYQRVRRQNMGFDMTVVHRPTPPTLVDGGTPWVTREVTRTTMRVTLADLTGVTLRLPVSAPQTRLTARVQEMYRDAVNQGIQAAEDDLGRVGNPHSTFPNHEAWDYGWQIGTWETVSN